MIIAVRMREITSISMLTGPDLLQHLKELGDIPKSDLVRSCGYVSRRQDGSERLNFTAFYEALLEAKGMHLGAARAKGEGRRGRKLSYATKVQFNGNLMVGSAYVAKLGLQPGDQCHIRLGRHQIQLVPTSEAERQED